MSFIGSRRARGRAQSSSSNQVRNAIESLEVRRLLVAVAWDGGGDGVDWFDGANWSTNAVPTSNDDVTINVVANPSIQLDRPTTIRSLVNVESLTLLGNGTFGVAQLSIDQGGSNAGTITLDGISVGAGRLSVLNGAFENTGTIRSQGTGANQIDVSTSGGAAVSLTNNGTIDVSTGEPLIIAGQADDSFIQQGLISIASGERLTLSNLALTYNGGSNAAGVYIHSSSIDINSASAASTLIAYGTNTLIGHDAANVTLGVRGEGQQFGPAVLNIPETGLVSSGIIELDSLNLQGARIATSGGTFTNSGTILVNAGIGSIPSISGPAASTFANNGTITIGGPGARFNISGIGFRYSGGSNSDGLFVNSTAIDLDAANSPSTVIAYGNNTLLGHDAANLTLTVQGENQQFGTADLTVQSGGIINNGKIVLDGLNGSGSRLIIASGTFTNGAAGQITATAGATREIFVSTSGSTAATFASIGAISVLDGARLSIAGQNDDQFIQNGTITVGGSAARLTISGATLRYNGGSNSPGVYAHSSSIDINAASAASTLIAYGATTLLGNDASNFTLRVEGENQQFGPATLDIPETGASNNGIIELGEMNGNGSSIRVVGGTFTNSGTIRATGAGARSISITTSTSVAGVLVNSGTINVTAGTALNVDGDSGDEFVQQGTITIGGAGAIMTLARTKLTYNSGSNSAGLYIHSAAIDLNSASAASTLIAYGTNTLLGHDAANVTLRVQGENQQFGPAALDIAATVTNNGLIELDGLSGNSSQIRVLSGTFTNAGTIRALPGGQRSLVLSNSNAVDVTMINSGTIQLDANTNLEAFGQTGDTLTQQGTISISAGARMTIAQLGFNYNGGSNTSGLYVNSSRIDVNTADAASTLIAYGSNVLLGHDASLLTLLVQGENQQFGPAVLRIESDGVVNNGTIVLDGLAATSSSILIETGTFTNGATGVIRAADEAQRGIGISDSSAVAATFVNNGSVAVDDAALLLVNGQAGDIFRQNGTITVGGMDARLRASGVTFRYAGGTNTAGLYVDSGAIGLDAAAAPSTVIAQGNNTLLGHDAANITLVAQGENQLFGPATLTSATNTTNNGLILLDGFAGQSSGINVPAGATFTNGVTGLIRLMLTGGTPTITVSSATNPGPGTFINNGIIRFTGDVDLGGNGEITNQGRIEKPDAGESEFGPRLFNTTNGVVDISAGALRVTGDSNVDEGTFLSSGRYTIGNGAALRFGFSGGPTVLTADVELRGTAQADLGSLEFNRGRIALEDGADLTIAPNNNLFTHEGIIDLSPTSVLTINANFAHAGTSQPIIRTEIASLTDFGRVTINGSANLNSPDSSSRLDPDLVAPFDPALGTQFPVFIATGGITNAFDGFLGGLTPSSSILKLVRPNAQTAAVEIAPGPLPPPPMILSTSYEFETREALTFQFDQDVSAFLGRKDYRLENLTTGQTIAQSAGTLSYNQTSNQATLTLTNQVPDGNYLLTIQASDISNGAGVPATNGITFPFFIFRGDANRDRTINISDFAILASRFNLAGTFSQGDFSYDGQTNINDFAILAAKFNSTLPAASPRMTAFSQTPLHKTPSWQRDDVEDFLSN